MRKLVVALFLLCAAVSPSALRASMIDYHFSFTNLQDTNGTALPNFSFDIVTPTFITSTTLTSLLTADPTTLGFTVDNYGEDMEGFFGFFQTGGSIGESGAIGFNGTSFDFAPNTLQTDYYQTLGTYTGTTIGNDAVDFPSTPFFFGDATLTITPEPSTIALLGTGMSSLMYFGRRRFLRS